MRITLFGIALRLLARTIVALVGPGTILARAIFTGPVVTGPVVTGAILTRTVVAGPVFVRTAIVGTRFPLLGLGLLLRLLLLRHALGLAERAGEIVVLVVLAFAAIFAYKALVLVAEFLARAAWVVFLVARAGFAEHTEIMIGKLEIIFGQHTITGLLRIASERFIFLEQLRRVAARPVVDPVATFGPATAAAAAAIAARTVLALATPTATATGLLTIIDQLKLVLSKGF
ncbi:MAG: hypothetical protein JWL66_490 [Sphingomonadales bacterium]|nr:hypothetical protein [Sphingomonadales bacterium]